MLMTFGDLNVSAHRSTNRRRKMTAEKILTKHPLGKSGRNIDRNKYDTLKKAIVSALRKDELTHTELFSRLNRSLKGKFSGNISWYGETVKLDLEAKKIIERTASKPQRYRLKSR
jgi:Family of unknown function (DUF6958)